MRLKAAAAAGFGAIMLTSITLGTGTAMAQEDVTEMPVPPVLAEDHGALLASDNPRLAANKQLVYDMYRIEDGRIAEHWDPMLKSDPKIDPNNNRL